MVSGSAGRGGSKWVIRLLGTAASSVFLMAILLHLVTDSVADQTQLILNALRMIVWPWISAYLVFQLLQTYFRAVRYGVLLRAAGEASIPSTFHLYLVTMARNMFVDLLPSRTGELVYIGLLNRGYRLSARSCISSLAISFVFDLIALGLVFVILLLLHLHALKTEGLVFAIAGALFLIIPGMALAGLYASPALYQRMTFLHPRADGRGLMQKLLGFIRDMVGSIASTRASGTFGRTLALSFGVRVFKYAGLFAAFRAVTSASFPEFSDASLVHVLTAFLSSEAAASLPAPTLMGFGVYEAGGTAAWTTLGFPAAAASVLTTVLHLCSQAVDYSLGGIGLVLFSLFVGSTASPTANAMPTRANPRLRLAGAALLALVLAGSAVFAGMTYRSMRKQGATSAPPKGAAVDPDTGAEQALQALWKDRKGFIVWSSNRSGSHDLWLLNPATGKERRLTADEFTDTFPRISPDGRRVLFSRSREPWVSQRKRSLWDTWIVDLDTLKETRVAEYATNADWIDDGSIVFHRRETQVVQHVIASGIETVLMQAGNGDLPADTVFETPSYNADTRQLIATLRGAVRTPARVDAGRRYVKIPGGCQHHWTASRTRIIGVGSGHMKNAILRIDPATLRDQVLYDAPGEWSHEYFPRLSRDESLLIYAACREGHEHDTADYELFLWSTSTPPEAAVRLTWHTGNDCWPDLWVE